MENLSYDPTKEIRSPMGSKISAGMLTDFVGGLTGDRFDDSRPSLSDYFTTRGVDAGLSLHNNTSRLYAEANPWIMHDTQTPAEGVSGMMVERNGHLSFGALVGGGDSAVYVSGEYSVRFGEAGWTPPEDHVFHTSVYDDMGYETGETEENIISTDGYHSYKSGITTLSFEGYADTIGGLHLEGRAEHERSLIISDREFGLEGFAAAGYNDEAGPFGKLGAEINAMLHEPSGTYGYLRGSWQAAQNEGFDTQSVEMGISSTLGEKIPAPVELGVQYDGQEFKPATGIGLKF